MKNRVRDVIAQVAEEMGIKIENGVLSSDHIHVFVNVPPHIKISDFVQKAKGRSSKRIQEEFPSMPTSWGLGSFAQEQKAGMDEK